jgi:hypothetical protein
MRTTHRGAMPLPGVPPRSPLDPVPAEIIVPFLDAAARVTNAFRELRDDILPTVDASREHGLAVGEWLHKWRLDNFADDGVNEHIRSWVSQILDWWKRDGRAAEELRVDCGYDFKLSTRGVRTVRINRYDGRNSPDDYAQKIRSQCERLIHEELGAFKQDVEKFGLITIRRRNRGRNLNERFEWLALWLCAGMSDSEIAERYRMARTERQLIRKDRNVLFRQGFQQRK